MSKSALPRYDRQPEQPIHYEVRPQIALADLAGALATADLSSGSRDLITSLIRLGKPALFPGGGVGLDYGALLKTAARPDVLGNHIGEVAQHLRGQSVDLLVVPGMSGYPIGAMYAMASGIPAILLKKQAVDSTELDLLPPGAFVIPSYTGNVDTVISADLLAAEDVIRGIVDRQLAAQSGADVVQIEIRIAGADEIIDKATMATAITETAPVFVRSVVDTILVHRKAIVNDRPLEIDCRVVAWVTPLLKAYGGSTSVLATRFGIEPFAGATITAIQFEPPAIGFGGLGLVLLEGQR